MNMSKRSFNGWMAGVMAAASIVMLPVSASAQSVTGGIRAGATASWFQNEDDEDSKKRLGVSPGIFVDFNVNPRLAIRLEGAYVMKGIRGDGGDYTVALDYIEAPILLNFRPSASGLVALQAGVAPARKIGAQIKSGDQSLKYGDMVHAFDLGLVVGVAVGPVDVRYTRGLKSVFNFNDPEDSDSDDKNQTISVGVSIKLFGKRQP